MRFRTKDGNWSISTMTLTDTAAPSRYGDPEYGPGEYLFAKGTGMFIFARTPAELFRKLGVDPSDVMEVFDG